MTRTNVLVVYKESTFSRYGSTEHLVRGFKKNKHWGVIKGSHARHLNTLEIVERVLRQRKFKVAVSLRSGLKKIKNIDRRFRLVVSVGGDGTFLDCSHYLWKTPLMGVNSDPQQSVACLCGCDAAGFPEALEGYLSGRVKPAQVWRLDFFINGKKGTVPVFNDLLIASLSPAATSRYILKAGKRVEEQMSSGVWVSSAAGSTAAALSAGGKPLPAGSRLFQFVTREPYHRKFGPRRFLNKVFRAGQSLEVISYMRQGRVFVDGSNLTVPFKMGDCLNIQLSPSPLKVIGLKT